MTGTEHHWLVPEDLPAFDGHFPGRPIVPGVVLLDRVMRLAQEAMPGVAPGAWLVSQVKFLSPCGPGEELVFSFGKGARAGWTFDVRSGGREVATGSLQARAA